MSPQLEPSYGGIREIRLFLRVQLHDAGPDVAAADINSQDAVVTRQDPRGHQLHTTEEACMVRIVPDGFQLDVPSIGLEEHSGAPDGELTDAALAQPAAHHDSFGILPTFQAQQSPHHRGKFLRKLLDGSVNHASRLGVAVGEQLVELLLADLVAGRVAERILARLAHALAPIIQNRLERALAGAVTNEPVGGAKLRV